MENTHVLRVGATAAFTGVVAQLIVSFIEPARFADTDDRIRRIAGMDPWTGRWLVHLAGIFLVVTALVVVTRTLAGGPGRDWAQVGLPLLVIAGALGAAEVVVGAGTKDLANGWASAPPGSRLPYLTAFEAAWNTTVYLDFGAIVAVGLFQLALAGAILSSSVYSRRLGWATAVSGALGLVGIVLELWSPVGTALNLVSALTLFVVLIAFGRSLWREAAQTGGSGARLPSAAEPKGQTT